MTTRTVDKERESIAREIRAKTVWSLAGDAECSSPDTNNSPGARFLASVADGVAELIEYADPDVWSQCVADQDGQELDYSGACHEIADGAPSVYTATKWSEFVDLGAWQEDVSDYGETRDMDQAGSIALYVIAERLVWSLIGEALERADELAENPADE